MTDHPAPDAETLATLRENHDYPAPGWCHECEVEIAPCPVMRLFAAHDAALAALASEREKLADAQAEIRRHHQDFERWEDMAAKGAESLQERDTLRATLEAERGEVALLWQAVDDLGRLAGPGMTTAEALRVLSDLKQAVRELHATTEGQSV